MRNYQQGDMVMAADVELGPSFTMRSVRPLVGTKPNSSDFNVDPSTQKLLVAEKIRDSAPQHVSVVTNVLSLLEREE